MSNSLAIATVTVTLKAVLTGAIARAKDRLPGGAELEVTTVRPNPENTDLPAKGVNIYLIQVAPNGSGRNADLPARRSDGTMIQRPQAALDLHYLLSFHGDENKWEPQRLLGIVEQTLHARPTMSRETIRSSVAALGANAGFEFILKSDLSESPELVRFTPMSLSLEEMSKVWSVFLQTPYHLSALWRASVVFIEADDSPEPAQPVRAVTFSVGAMARPVLDRVVHPDGAGTPITAPGKISLLGRDLRGDVTRVLIDGRDFGPATADVRSERILLDLDPSVQAGVHGVQVAHSVQLGIPPLPHLGPESNVAPFILHPRITGTIATAGTTIAPDGSISASLTVPVAPSVGRSQRVVLQLRSLPAVTPPLAYAFTAGPRPAPSSAADPTVTVAVTGVKPATYHVKLLVDGAYDAPVESTRQVTLP